MRTKNGAHESMTIGQVAKQADIGIETIRFYERKGLLAKPSRRESGYRQYDEQVISQLLFIRRAQGLGFSLKEIEELLALRFNPKSTCGAVKGRAEVKIADIEQKISDLQKMRKSLLKLTNACSGGSSSVSECPILESFKSGQRKV